MDKIYLEKISWENYSKVLKLRVTKEQDNFVARNNTSLIQAFLCVSEGIPVHSFAIKCNKKVVGFMQIMYDNDWTGYEREDWLNSDLYKEYEGKPYYDIWRFMIDKKYQQKGYGRAAFKETLDFIKKFPDGKADYVLLSYNPTNKVAKKLYDSFGFNEVFKEYLHEDDEVTSMLKL